MTGMRTSLLLEDKHEAWDSWLRAIPYSNVRQTSFYKRALALYGHTAEIRVLERDGTFAAGALIGIRPTAPLIGPLVHVSGGIGLADPQDAAALGDFVDDLLDRCAELGACALELTLRVPRRRGELVDPAAAGLEATLRERGFEPAAPLATYWIDLGRASEDELLESLSKKTRRDIRKARREGLTVETTHDPTEFEEFAAVQTEMCRRKGITPRPRWFTSELLLPLVEAGLGALFIARFNDRPRNYLFTGSVGNPFYHWGALADAAHEDGCPPTGQALHFTAMCHYRGLGRDYYDLGGTPGPEPDPSHPNYSVWKFKHQFGGDFIDYLGSWNRNLRPLRAGALRTAKDVFNRLRRAN